MYQEPRVTLKTNLNPKYNTGTTPALIPVIIGDGPRTLTTTVKLVRSSNAYDSIPNDAVVEIVSVGILEGASDYTKTTDYSLSSNKITWSVEEGATSPTVGQSYYVTYSYTPNDSQYEPKLIGQKSDIVKYYGKNVSDSGDINPVALGCELALANSSLVYGLQVKCAGSAMTTAEMEAALAKYEAFLTDSYRIIPMTSNKTFNLSVINHVNKMSSPDEGMERATIVYCPQESNATVDSAITALKSYAGALKNERVMLVYPDKATKILDDGIEYELPAQYICAALAGWKAGKMPQTSFTKGQLTCFNELKGFKLTRSQKNNLAAAGVTILEQLDGAGSPIEIRHGLTTDMSSVQTREASIVDVTDYCSKYFRDGLKSYIGQSNITSDLISRVRATLNTMIDVLSKEKVIVSGSIIGVYQDEADPTALVVSVSIQVPYPCNNIEITLYME